MKTTFITTIFNEEGIVQHFLDSILNQSRKPDEIVIVDGGSSDQTITRIKNYELRFKEKGIRFKLIKKKGNRSVGRNEAIENAENEIILVSDAGCILDNDWVKNISSPFNDKNVDVVAGFYKPTSNSVFEKCLATYTSVMQDKIDPKNFLPSSRSVAFKQSAWEMIGGYPQWLDTCEDLYFARELKRNGFKFKLAQNAYVLWPQRKNLRQAFIQFFNYAKGDGTARYIRPNTPLLFARYGIGMLLAVVALKTHSIALLALIFLLLASYISWSIFKNYKYVKEPQAFIHLPLLQFTSDLAVISGMSLGFIFSLGIKKK